jgi:hypothetical protein
MKQMGAIPYKSLQIGPFACNKFVCDIVLLTRSYIQGQPFPTLSFGKKEGAVPSAGRSIRRDHDYEIVVPGQALSIVRDEEFRIERKKRR